MPATMKAMRVHELGGPFKLEEVPVPAVGPNDALVKLKATGVGLTPVLMRRTPGTIDKFPRIMGHEIAAEVIETGSAVECVSVGDLVTAHFYLVCHSCDFCRSGRETLCENFKGYLGLVHDGGYAEYASIPALNLCKIPEGITPLDACVAADGICTPYHNCTAEAQIKPGDKVAIIGAGGGVAIHAVQMAQLCGGEVIGVDVSKQKLETVAKLGAIATIDASDSDTVEEITALTKGRGVDAYIDYVGSKETLEAGMDTLGKGGKLVIVGSRAPSAFGGVSPKFTVDPQRVLQMAQEIHGSRYFSMLELRRSLQLVKSGLIKPIVTKTFQLEDTETAFQEIQDNKITGRAAVVFD
ncbi:MAG: zinc-binding dehydrogenase [Nitrospinaceae bacterium]|nr:zinc-binding dehydrogenase [Nitrospinaceae bacterium]